MSNLSEQGAQSYQEWKAQLLANPEFRAIYEAEGAKLDCWFKIMEHLRDHPMKDDVLADLLGTGTSGIESLRKKYLDGWEYEDMRSFVLALGLEVPVIHLEPYKGYVGEMRYDEVGNVFTSEVTGLQDLIAFHGTNIEEATMSFLEGVDDYLKLCEAEGLPPNTPSAE